MMAALEDGMETEGGREGEEEVAAEEEWEEVREREEEEEEEEEETGGAGERGKANNGGRVRGAKGWGRESCMEEAKGIADDDEEEEKEENVRAEGGSESGRGEVAIVSEPSANGAGTVRLEGGGRGDMRGEAGSEGFSDVGDEEKQLGGEKTALVAAADDEGNEMKGSAPETAGLSTSPREAEEREATRADELGEEREGVDVNDGRDGAGAERNCCRFSSNLRCVSSF